jgi:tetratricopeptide (TPR) repeat protein
MEDAMAAFRLAGEHLNAGRFDQAEEQALAALRAYPRMAAAQRILGLVYLQQGRMDRAISVLETSLRTEPFHPEALTNLAFAYLQAGNPGLALELIETCRRLHPDYKPALLQHGLMLLADPDSTEAVGVLREAVDAFPGLPGPRNNLAVALARAGDREGAREQLTAILDLDPANFSALFNLGALHAAETNAPAAIPWLRRAMQQTNPSEFRRYLNDPDLAPSANPPSSKPSCWNSIPSFPPPRPRRPPRPVIPPANSAQSPVFPDFPWHGKPRGIFSMAWKIRISASLFPPRHPAYGAGFPIQTARLVAGSDKSPPSDHR